MHEVLCSIPATKNPGFIINILATKPSSSQNWIYLLEIASRFWSPLFSTKIWGWVSKEWRSSSWVPLWPFLWPLPLSHSTWLASTLLTVSLAVTFYVQCWLTLNEWPAQPMTTVLADHQDGFPLLPATLHPGGELASNLNLIGI